MHSNFIVSIRKIIATFAIAGILMMPSFNIAAIAFADTGTNTDASQGQEAQDGQEDTGAESSPTPVLVPPVEQTEGTGDANIQEMPQDGDGLQDNVIPSVEDINEDAPSVDSIAGDSITEDDSASQDVAQSMADEAQIAEKDSDESNISADPQTDADIQDEQVIPDTSTVFNDDSMASGSVLQQDVEIGAQDDENVNPDIEIINQSQSTGPQIRKCRVPTADNPQDISASGSVDSLDLESITRVDDVSVTSSPSIDSRIEEEEGDDYASSTITESAGGMQNSSTSLDFNEDAIGEQNAQEEDCISIAGVTPPQSPDGNTASPSAPAMQNPETGIADDSTASQQASYENIIEIVNVNDAQVVNNADAEILTGKNSIEGDGGKNASIESGDINLFANVLNVLNTNFINSEITEIVENFNELSADIILNHPEAQPSDFSRDIVKELCGDNDIDCQSVNSFKLINRNNADVENNVNLSGDSGDNSIKGIEEDARIRSGNVNVVANILNIVNVNVVNSRWTIASINVFGDWDGDLVLPSELFFADYAHLGQTYGTEVSPQDVQKINIEINNANEIEIQNNVDLQSDSGLNSIETTGDADGSAGDANNNEIASGDSLSLTNANNFVNTTVYNGKWYLGMINMLGAWSGNVYSLPDEVVMSTSPTGLTFFAANTLSSDESRQVLTDTLAPDMAQTATTSIGIENVNDAKIVNNVGLDSMSGKNNIEGRELDDSGIFSGTTKALANILNFANTNLINADFHVGTVNIFGNWSGNVLFGYPDLSLDQEFLGEDSLSSVKYRVNYANEGDSSIDDTVIQWQYDDDFTIGEITGIEEENDYTTEPGIANFELGTIAPKQTGSIDISLSPIQDIVGQKSFTTFGRIFGDGIERNTDNNSSVLLSDVSDLSGIDSGIGGNASPVGISGDNGQNNDSDVSDSGLSPSEDVGTGADSEGMNPPSDNAQDGTQDQNGQDSAQNSEPTSDGQEQQNNYNADETMQNQQEKDSPPEYRPPINVIIYRDLMRVYKSNDANEDGVGPGEVVNFKLTVDNDGMHDLYDVVAYDILRAPDGTVVNKNEFPLGTLRAREEVVIPYSLPIPQGAPEGIYTNTAYLEGFNVDLQVINSEQSAVSSFRINDLTMLKDVESVKDSEDNDIEQVQKQDDTPDDSLLEDEQAQVKEELEKEDDNKDEQPVENEQEKNNLHSPDKVAAIAGNTAGSENLPNGQQGSVLGAVNTIKFPADYSGNIHDKAKVLIGGVITAQSIGVFMDTAHAAGADGADTASTEAGLLYTLIPWIILITSVCVVYYYYRKSEYNKRVKRE